MFRAAHFAWLSLVRQPTRALLGIAGIAAIGALLFDMLLLSRGLVLSFGDLLGQSGFDVRTLASEAPHHLSTSSGRVEPQCFARLMTESNS